MKKCKDCPADISHRGNNSACCEPCALLRKRAYNRTYWKENREKLVADKRVKYKENRKEMCATVKAYQAEHKEEISTRRRDRYKGQKKQHCVYLWEKDGFYYFGSTSIAWLRKANHKSRIHSGKHTKRVHAVVGRDPSCVEETFEVLLLCSCKDEARYYEEKLIRTLDPALALNTVGGELVVYNPNWGRE